MRLSKVSGIISREADYASKEVYVKGIGVFTECIWNEVFSHTIRLESPDRNIKCQQRFCRHVAETVVRKILNSLGSPNLKQGYAHWLALQEKLSEIETLKQKLKNIPKWNLFRKWSVLYQLEPIDSQISIFEFLEILAALYSIYMPVRKSDFESVLQDEVKKRVCSLEQKALILLQK